MHEQCRKILPYPRCQPRHLPVGIEFAQQEIGGRIAGLRAGELICCLRIASSAIRSPDSGSIQSRSSGYACRDSTDTVSLMCVVGITSRVGAPVSADTNPEMPSVDCGVSPKPVLVFATLIGKPRPVSEKSFSRRKAERAADIAQVERVDQR